MTPPRYTDADFARTLIHDCHGLANAADLATLWGVSRARVYVLIDVPGFPLPVAHVGGRPVWLVSDAQTWRTKRQAKARR